MFDKHTLKLVFGSFSKKKMGLAKHGLTKI